MAKTFRPKEVLREAEQAEVAGNARVASRLFHTLALHLSKRERWPEAYEFIERAIHLSKRSARLYVLKARLAEKMGQPEERTQALKTFISYSLQKDKLGEYIAYLEDQLKDLPQLRKCFFEELLKIERTTSFAFLGLAKTCIELSDFERAKGVLLDCLKTKDQPQKTIELLHAVLENSKATHAIPFLEKFVAGELGYDELVVLLGGKKEGVSAVAISDGEGEKDLKGLIADLERELGVSVETELDSVKPLVHEFRKRAGMILKDDAKSRMDLSLAFFEMGLFQDASDELKYIRPADPLYISAVCLQGKIFMAQGADLKALNNYQSVIRERSAGPETVKDALYQLVEIYFRMGDCERALEYAERLEKMDPAYRDIHRIKITIKDRPRQ